MAFTRKYPNSKDARKRFHRYYDSRDFDKSCRTNRCPYCLSTRTHSTLKRLEQAEDSRREFVRLET